MTPRHKLTRWDEWEIGAEYESNSLYWEKAVYRLEEINRKEGWILMRKSHLSLAQYPHLIPAIKFRDWRNKFRKVHPVE